MKVKHLLSALVITLGLTAFTSAKAAVPTESRIIRDSTVRVLAYGLTSGSVNVQISNNGQTYYFSGSALLRWSAIAVR